MSEGFTESREGLPRRPVAAEVSPQEALVMPKAEAGTDERLALVRERLGLSRREVLAAGAAFAVVAPEEVVAKQERYLEPGFTPEAQIHYEACLGQLRESARSHDSELARLFVVRPDGTFSWVAPSNEQTHVVQGGEYASGLLHVPDQGFANVRDQSLLEGAVVIDQHTHPTRAFSSMPADGNDALRGRVPPSPTDVLGSVWVTSRLPDEETVTRYRREVVTEQGVWRYGPVSKQAASSLSEALDAGDRKLLSLDTRHRVEGRALGQYVMELVDAGHLSEGMRGMSEMLLAGRFGRMLAENPAAVSSLAQFSELSGSIGIPLPPREARAYLREVERANQQTQTALGALSGSAEQNHLDIPYVTPENFDAYQERWQRLGMSMSFRPFSQRSPSASY